MGRGVTPGEFGKVFSEWGVKCLGEVKQDVSGELSPSEFCLELDFVCRWDWVLGIVQRVEDLLWRDFSEGEMRG